MCLLGHLCVNSNWNCWKMNLKNLIMITNISFELMCSLGQNWSSIFSRLMNRCMHYQSKLSPKQKIEQLMMTWIQITVYRFNIVWLFQFLALSFLFLRVNDKVSYTSTSLITWTISIRIYALLFKSIKNTAIENCTDYWNQPHSIIHATFNGLHSPNFLQSVKKLS